MFFPHSDEARQTVWRAFYGIARMHIYTVRDMNLCISAVPDLKSGAIGARISESASPQGLSENIYGKGELFSD